MLRIKLPTMSDLLFPSGGATSKANSALSTRQDTNGLHSSIGQFQWSLRTVPTLVNMFRDSSKSDPSARTLANIAG